MYKFFITLFTAMFLLIAQVGAEVTAETSKPVLLDTEPITAGAVLKDYRWDTSSGAVNLYVIEVDLKNPHIQVEVIPGKGKLTQRLNVSAMANNTGAVAAVNGDFYNLTGEGAPIGPMVMGSKLVSSPSFLQGIYALGITKDRNAYIGAFTFDGKVTAPNGAEYKLSGINKTPYMEDGGNGHSHAHKLHLYNDLWGGMTRGHDSATTPTEMLIKDGEVIDIIEGNYFNFPVPDGMYILRGHGEAAKFMVENFEPGSQIDIQYLMEPNKEWAMVIGGHSLLVNEGKAVPYERSSSGLGGVRARTAAGISKDGSTLYIVGVEGRTPASVGISLTNLSKFLEEIGVWKALNLDGGGSTTMVSRPLGDWQISRVFPTEQGSERLVVNALGIYSTAPKGELKGLIVSGNELLLLNEETSYSLKGYDEYYNPVNTENLSVNWQVSQDLGIFKGNSFTALKPGIAEIIASSGIAKVNLPIEIVGKNSIKKMTLSSNTTSVAKGSSISLNLYLETFSGKTKEVPANLVDWQLWGINGQVSADGTLTIAGIDETKDVGFVVARYDGFSAPLPLIFNKEKIAYDFQNLDRISFEGYPMGVTGNISIVNDAQLSKPVTELNYDFTNGQGTTAAYIKFSGEGIAINQNVEGLMMQVSGDGGNQWLRAEFVDGNGSIQRLDFANSINWSGWRGVYLDLEGKNLSYPLHLKRIYVASTEEQRGQRAVQGNLLFSDLKLVYSSEEISTPEAQKVLELTINQKEMTVDGIKKEMDVAPVLTDGRTLVPVRFVSEALGASVLWDGTTRNATVIQDNRWIDLWPGEDMMVVDGRAVSLDVPLQLINGRTMLPLRAVAESLDINVHWEPETRKITLNN